MGEVDFAKLEKELRGKNNIGVYRAGDADALAPCRHFVDEGTAAFLRETERPFFANLGFPTCCAERAP